MTLGCVELAVEAPCHRLCMGVYYLIFLCIFGSTSVSEVYFSSQVFCYINFSFDVNADLTMLQKAKGSQPVSCLMSLHFPLFILISQQISLNTQEAQVFPGVWFVALKPLLPFCLQTESLRCSCDARC